MTEFKRLFDVLPYQLERFPQQVCVADKKSGEWVTCSTQQAIDQVNRVSRAFYANGLRPGDKIGMVSANRSEWNWVDMGSLQAGLVNVPLYTSIPFDEYVYILNEAEVRLLFVGDRLLYRKVKDLRMSVPSLEAIYTFDKIPDAPHWGEWLEKGNSIDQQVIEDIKASIQPDDLATLIYTSGTTGKPKGVMISHHNLVSNVIGSTAAVDMQPGHRSLSSLPLNHIFERMGFYLFQYRGCNVYYAERMDTIADNMREIKPHYMTTVPRLLEKVFEKIMAKGKALTGVKKKLFYWAVELGLQYDPEQPGSLSYRSQLWLANKLVFKKWRDALGNEVRGIISGAAALQPRLARIFNAAGIRVQEGYGLTEASPVIAANRYTDDKMRIGTVGPPLENLTVRIAEDGEILVKGPNVMLGYYKQPELTRQAIDEDGWLHTGDIGVLDKDNFLKITDRKKELFKNSGGKYIAPQPIENAFKESFFVEQIMIVGENRKTVSALIVPSMGALEEWCREQGLPCNSKEQMLDLPEVHKKYADIRDEINKKFSDVERVRRFILLPDEWTIDSGELTATLKLKRRNILQKYHHEIEHLYHGEE